MAALTAEHPSGSKIASQGVVRGEEIHIRIKAGDLSAETIDLAFLDDKERTGSRSLAWPSDFKVTDTGNPEAPFEGFLRLDLADLPDACSQIALSGSVSGRFEDGEDWCLYNLRVKDPKDFESKFFRIKRRIRDTETLAFCMCRILDNYHGNRAHRCVAAVILAYKSIDLGDEVYLDKALGHIEAESARLDELTDTDHPRTDRTHLTFSLYIVKVHLLIVTGAHEAVYALLHEIRARAMQIENKNSGLCYNTCRMLLLGGYIEMLMGRQEEAAEWFKDNFDFYCTSYGNIARNQVWFKELSEAHHAVWVGLRYLDEFAGTGGRVPKNTAFEAFNRIRSETGMKRLYDAFNGTKKWAKAKAS